jgi:hypothetical protein
MAASHAQFKYQSELKTIAECGATCPPADAVEATLTAYRWCASPITTQCFLPQARRNPPRLHKAKDLDEQCSCWALSMHTDLEASVNAFQSIEQSFRRIRKIFGGFVAVGDLHPSHGRCTPPNSNAHFDVHEYKSGNVAAAFTIHSEIPAVA